LVVRMSDPQKEFLYQDSDADSYIVDAANSSYNVFSKKGKENKFIANRTQPNQLLESEYLQCKA
jgi:hypothetical protein